MSVVQGFLSLVGRVALVGIFLLSAVANKIPNFQQTAGHMANEGVPAPQVLLAGAIGFLILGSLSVLIGFKARLGATLLLAFLAAATYYFHDFWTVPADAMWVHSQQPDFKLPVAMIEQINFMKNVALMGAMLLIIANGAGAWSWDGCCGGSAKTAPPAA
jgi:putative oxidoreductase